MGLDETFVEYQMLAFTRALLFIDFFLDRTSEIKDEIFLKCCTKTRTAVASLPVNIIFYLDFIVLARRAFMHARLC